MPKVQNLTTPEALLEECRIIRHHLHSAKRQSTRVQIFAEMKRAIQRIHGIEAQLQMKQEVTRRKKGDIDEQD
jgi:hypothetical protein